MALLICRQPSGRCALNEVNMTLPPIKTTINDHTVFIEHLSDEDGEFWVAAVFTCKKHGLPIICQGNSYKEALDNLRKKIENES